MSKFSPEVLIYIQNLKTYFSKNQDSWNYFFSDVDEETLYEHLGEISEKNFKENGDPSLSEEQFELLKKTLRALSVLEHPLPKTVWWDLGKLGLICLN